MKLDLPHSQIPPEQFLKLHPVAILEGMILCRTGSCSTHIARCLVAH